MAPSNIDANEQLSCSMWLQQVEALSKLHHHQMRSHTAEELSLALLVQRGFEPVTDDMARLERGDAVGNGLCGDSHFPLHPGVCSLRHDDSSSSDGSSSPETLVIDMNIDGESYENPETVKNILIKMGSKESELADNVGLQKTFEFVETTPKRRVYSLGLQQNGDETLDSRASTKGCETDSDGDSTCGDGKMSTIKLDLSVADSCSDKQRENSIVDCESIGIAPLAACMPKCTIANFYDWRDAEKNPLVPLADAAVLQSSALSVERCDQVSARSSPDVPKAADQSSSLGRHSKRKKQQTPRRYLNNQYLLPSSVATLKHKPQSPGNVAGDTRVDVPLQCGSWGPSTCLVQAQKDVLSFTSRKEPHLFTDLAGGSDVATSQSTIRNSVRKTQKQFGLTRSRKLSQASGNGKKQSFRKIKGKKKVGRKIGSEKTDLKFHCNPTKKESLSLDSEIESLATKREAFMPILCDSMENIASSSSSREDMWMGTEYNNSVKIIDAKDLMKIYPPGMTDRRFFCEPCGKGYTKKSHLERHLRVHTGERPFPCTFCGKSFAVRSILKQHVRIHTGEKPYCCTVCAHRFPQKSGLMTHMMLHTGKPFKCDRCTKAFVSNHKLLQHLRCHNGQGSHVCSVCKMNFFAEAALKEHVKHHTQKHAHTCMMCNASFLLEGHLKQHLDRHLEKLIIKDGI